MTTPKAAEVARLLEALRHEHVRGANGMGFGGYSAIAAAETRDAILAIVRELEARASKADSYRRALSKLFDMFRDAAARIKHEGQQSPLTEKTLDGLLDNIDDAREALAKETP